MLHLFNTIYINPSFHVNNIFVKKNFLSACKKKKSSTLTKNLIHIHRYKHKLTPISHHGIGRGHRSPFCTSPNMLLWFGINPFTLACIYRLWAFLTWHFLNMSPIWSFNTFVYGSTTSSEAIHLHWIHFLVILISFRQPSLSSSNPE